MSEVKENRQQRPNRPLSLRQRHALATRSAIIAAAQALFLERGYVATTIEAIAKEAGTGVSTVYFVFGSKLAILKAIRAQWHEQSQINGILDLARSQDRVEARLDLLAHGTRRQWELSAPVISIYKQAAAVDGQAAEELQRALAGRRAALNEFVRDLAGLAPEDVDVEHFAAVVRALCSHEVYDEMVTVSGWTADEFERWLAQALKMHATAPQGQASESGGYESGRA
jgi:AcrR family transcriptional regulator